MQHERARDADDVLWRRTKTGVHLSRAQRQAVADAVRQAQPARGRDAKPDLA